MIEEIGLERKSAARFKASIISFILYTNFSFNRKYFFLLVEWSSSMCIRLFSYASKEYRVY